MLSTNTLSVFILHHHINVLCSKNIRSIQEIMRASEPAAKKYERFARIFLILPYSPRAPHQANSS